VIMRRTTAILRAICLALGVVLAAVSNPGSAAAATIVIVNTDGPNEGFNSNTAAAPVGGNPGTTLGQQRLNVFVQAASIWGSILPSDVTIRIQSAFDDLACSATSAVLGSAGAINVARDFPDAPFPGTWYHIALANKIAGSDLIPAGNDINARFNSALNGNPACLGGRNWYYGFDGNEGTDIELLPVVLHEMAHGLGFSTFINSSTGQLFNLFPDIYSRFMLDTTLGLHWNEMTQAQRQASAINTLALVWDGPAVTTVSSLFLGGRPRIVVNAPAPIAGNYVVGTADFGPLLSDPGVTGDVVLAADNTGVSSDACEAIQNDVSGKIALIDRGTCSFASKAVRAQAAGAIGVILVDNVAGSTPPPMGGTDPSVTIPVASLTLANGNTLKAELGNGLNATLGADPSLLAGADAERRVFLYAPNPVQPGSSISHFDVSALPDVLMEPALSAGLSTNVDLTRYLFEDIGWLPQTTDVADATVVRLRGATPNPFGLTTTVQFELPHAEHVDLAIYDVAGRLVRRVVSTMMGPGLFSMVWDGTDERGRPTAPGVYFSVLKSAGETQSQRLVRLRG